MATTQEGEPVELPEPDSELVVEISCACGWQETVREAEHGQTLGGTAGNKGARHSCPYERGEKRTPKGVSSMRFNWVFR